ncbi:hypothetical protein UR09_03845 [Candidatus Nitromaritima sp. SCGC AAA799-A02]|nr:hypothetical protein UZ36_06090 [Candidatus Nitromaritima sp. SCGC AAA799-C22]KMP11232.1 hypothetical protein UR09_03845 [Candidatus Nitromaritima sp. SCGC AAA799-A02]
MPTTGTINTQQILQMGTMTEKLQQTMQQLPATTGQQLQEEQVNIDEVKRQEVQDPENLEAANPSNPEGRRRRQARIRKKAAHEEDSTQLSSETSVSGEPHQGQNVNLKI